MTSYFFRYQIISGFDEMIGDDGDARFITLICEHWYGVFQGDEPVRDLRVFYPQKNTLGYGDTLFAYAIPYSVFRAVGMDMFRSMQLVLILFYLLGGIGLFWLLNYKLKIQIFPAIIGTAMFILANNYFIKTSIHTQLILIGLVPWLFIFVYGFFENINKLRMRMLYGILSILFLFGLITFSGFYTAYFTALFMCIFGCVWIYFSWLADEKPFLMIFTFIRSNLLEISAYILTGVVALLPSVWIYLPVINSHGGRSFTDVLIYLPKWIDFFNVSYNNLVWGKFLKLFFPNMSGGELMTGFPVITILLFLVFVLYFLRRFRNKSLRFDVRLPLVIGVSILFVVLLILRVFDFSLWKIPYLLIPGTSALRVISRYNMFLSLPIAIVLAYGFDALLIKCKLKWIIKLVLIASVFTFLILENTVIMTNSKWSISEQRAQFENVVSPPQDCRIFVIINPKSEAPTVSQLDAWVIAIKYNLITINGYSGVFALAWDNLWDTNNLTLYNKGIQEWSQKNNISNLCAYDQINNKWKLDVLK
jgi:hypothetical protein